jgi:putative Mg2+ transporter-C (MgtC) family protein
VTGMHFLVVVGFLPLARRLSARLSGAVRLHVTYDEGRGVLTRLLKACDQRQWQLTELTVDTPGETLGATPGSAGVMLTLAGNGILNAPTVLAAVDGVTAIRQMDEDPD